MLVITKTMQKMYFVCWSICKITLLLWSFMYNFIISTCSFINVLLDHLFFIHFSRPQAFILKVLWYSHILQILQIYVFYAQFLKSVLLLFLGHGPCAYLGDIGTYIIFLWLASWHAGIMVYFKLNYIMIK